MSHDEDTPEVTQIKSRIESYLNAHGNKLDIDLTKDQIDFKKHSDTLFTGSNDRVTITLGFNDGSLTKNSSLEQLRAAFNFIALDRLPLPGLDGVPSQWQIYPQTPRSSFSEGITLEQYDPSTQVLRLTIQTEFFAIYGSLPQDNRLACGPAPKGTYLQVRQNIQGHIKVNAKLVFN